MVHEGLISSIIINMLRKENYRNFTEKLDTCKLGFALKFRMLSDSLTRRKLRRKYEDNFIIHSIQSLRGYSPNRIEKGKIPMNFFLIKISTMTFLNQGGYIVLKSTHCINKDSHSLTHVLD